MTDLRIIEGVMVSVRQQATPNGMGAVVSLPNGQDVLVEPKPGDGHETLDKAIAFLVNKFRVWHWREHGAQGAI